MYYRLEKERIILYLNELSEYLNEVQRQFEETNPTETNIEQSRIIVRKLQKDFWYYTEILKGKEFPKTKGAKKET